VCRAPLAWRSVRQTHFDWSGRDRRELLGAGRCTPRRRVWFAVLAIGGGAFVGCYSAGVLHKALGDSGSEQNPYPIAGAIAGVIVGIVLLRLLQRSTRSLGPDAIDYDDHSSGAKRLIDK
jgi:H+/Cl- antiporter ClcA